MIRTTEKEVEAHSSQRSDSAFSLDEITRCVAASFELGKAVLSIDSAYPGWSPVYNSHLLEIAKRSYMELFGKEAKVKTIHAGLECGLILQKYPNMEMISFGPTLRDVHTPEEKMYIPSVLKFWEHLTYLLAHL